MLYRSMLYRSMLFYQKALSKLVVLGLYHLGHLTLTANKLCIHLKNISVCFSEQLNFGSFNHG